MRKLISRLAFVILAVATLRAQSALEQLKAYSESAPATGKTVAPPTASAKTSPAGLPDIVGIRLGMPLREAYTLLQTAHPTTKLGTSAVFGAWD